MNTFRRLLSLYNKSGYDRTPLEDFCTECLAGILDSDQELLNAFVNEVLNIPSEEGFTLQTQKNYTLKDDTGRIDLVFESSSWICFLEMKVHSSEGVNQLKRYRNYLSDKINPDKKGALRYCTLYIEDKEELSEKEQLRWKDIAEFLEDKIESNLLIEEFYQFLKERKMAGNERFTYQDLIGLQIYGELTSKIGEVFQLIKDKMESCFGNTSRGVKSTSQAINHDRLAILCQDVLGDGGWSEVLVGFYFNGGTYSDGPLICVQIWVKKSNDSYNNFKKEVSKLDEYQFEESIETSGGAIRYKKPLADFIESENQIEEITGWIRDKLKALEQLKESTSQLAWNV